MTYKDDSSSSLHDPFASIDDDDGQRSQSDDQNRLSCRQNGGGRSGYFGDVDEAEVLATDDFSENIDPRRLEKMAHKLISAKTKTNIDKSSAI